MSGQPGPGRSSAATEACEGLTAALGDTKYQQLGPMSAWPGHRLPVTPRSTGCDQGCRAAAAWNLVFWTLPPCSAEPSLPGGSGHEAWKPHCSPGRAGRAEHGAALPGSDLPYSITVALVSWFVKQVLSRPLS